MSEVTRILDPVQQGEAKVAEGLLPLVYDDLRRLAATQLTQETPGQTLQATALVHEAYLRLVGNPGQQWNGARHFFLAAAQAMRRILIDNARRKRAARHGGGLTRVEVERLQLAAAMAPDEWLAADEAVERRAQVDASAPELVRLRFYAGLDHRQTAESLGVSRRTADRLWAFARAWLFQQLRGPTMPQPYPCEPTAQARASTPMKRYGSTGAGGPWLDGVGGIPTPGAGKIMKNKSHLVF